MGPATSHHLDYAGPKCLYGLNALLLTAHNLSVFCAF